MRRCTSEMRPCGNSTMRSTLSRPAKASTAAPPGPPPGSKYSASSRPPKAAHSYQTFVVVELSTSCREAAATIERFCRVGKASGTARMRARPGLLFSHSVLPPRPDQKSDEHHRRQPEPGDGVLQVIVLEMNVQRSGFRNAGFG